MRVLAVAAALTLAVTAPAAGAPSLGSSGCPLFPADNVWHADVSRLPVHPRSGAYLAAVGAGAGIHADFGSGTWEGGPIGIPYTVVGAGQPRVPVRFGYAGESDPGPYPIPPDAPVEGGPGAAGDRHVLVVQAGGWRLYGLFDAYWPARHHAGEAGVSLPPMGLRLRLRSGVDIGGFPYQARVLLQAMRTHGLVVADNGSSGFIGGVPDERWDNDALHQLRRVTLADFEAVDTSGLPTPSADPAAAGADPAPAPGPTGFVPQLLTAILGLVAAALAARVVLRTRRLQDRDRPPHPRSTPGRHVKADAPPDPDPTPTRRR